MNWDIGKIFNRIKKPTKEQKKIIYIGLIVLFSLLSFRFFVYGPQAKRFALMKKELTRTEAQIAEIKSIAEGKDLSQAVKELKIELMQVKSKLPPREEIVIQNLLESAKKLKIEVKNITPSSKRLLEARVGGYDIEELPISMSLVCEYRVLGEYLNILRNSFPILVRLRRLDIKGKGEGQINLDITLQISAYLSRKK